MSKIPFARSSSSSLISKLTVPLGRRSSNASPIRSSTTSSKTPVKSRTKVEQCDSKTSTFDKSNANANDISPWQTIQKYESNLISDSMLCDNLTSEDNSLEYSLQITPLNTQQ